MRQKINEIYKDINDLMKAANSFDVQQYEEILNGLEQLIGKDLDRDKENKIEHDMAKNIQQTILNTLKGEPSLDMIGIVEQIVLQAGNEYRAFKTKYMQDAIQFFIQYLDENIDGEKNTVEDEIDNELTSEEEEEDDG